MSEAREAPLADAGTCLDVMPRSLGTPRRPRIEHSQVDTLTRQMRLLREGLALAADRAAKLRVRDPAAVCDDHEGS